MLPYKAITGNGEQSIPDWCAGSYLGVTYAQ
jgi:hypothetical protein